MESRASAFACRSPESDASSEAATKARRLSWILEESPKRSVAGPEAARTVASVEDPLLVRFGILRLGNTYGTEVKVPRQRDGSLPSLKPYLSTCIEAEVKESLAGSLLEEEESCDPAVASGGAMLQLTLTAAREGSLHEKLYLQMGSPPEDSLVIEVKASIMGRGAGKPVIRPGVKLLRQADPAELDSEAGSMWQGFTRD